MGDGIVRCVDCNHVNAAKRVDGTLQPDGIDACPACDGVTFVPVVTEQPATDTVELPDADPPSAEY